jgi:transcriptional repressor NrdR
MDMAEVIKRNNRREPFEPWKVRRAIEYAALQADFPRERVYQLVERVSDPVMEVVARSGEVSTEAIRDIVLEALEAVEPVVAKEWKLFERIHKTRYVS